MRVEYVQLKNQILLLINLKAFILSGVWEDRSYTNQDELWDWLLTSMANLAMDKGERVNQSFTCDDAGILQ